MYEGTGWTTGQDKRARELCSRRRTIGCQATVFRVRDFQAVACVTLTSSGHTPRNRQVLDVAFFFIVLVEYDHMQTHAQATRTVKTVLMRHHIEEKRFPI